MKMILLIGVFLTAMMKDETDNRSMIELDYMEKMVNIGRLMIHNLNACALVTGETEKIRANARAISGVIYELISETEEHGFEVPPFIILDQKLISSLVCPKCSGEIKFNDYRCQNGKCNVQKCVSCKFLFEKKGIEDFCPVCERKYVPGCRM